MEICLGIVRPLNLRTADYLVGPLTPALDVRQGRVDAHVDVLGEELDMAVTEEKQTTRWMVAAEVRMLAWTSPSWGATGGHFPTAG